MVNDIASFQSSFEASNAVNGLWKLKGWSRVDRVTSDTSQGRRVEKEMWVVETINCEYYYIEEIA